MLAVERGALVCAVALFIFLPSPSRGLTLSSRDVVVQFRDLSPSYTLRFNKTTYGQGADSFYTKVDLKNVQFTKSGTYNFPSVFDSVRNGSFEYQPKNGNATLVHFANFTTLLHSDPLAPRSATIATLKADVLLFETKTRFSFVPGQSNGAYNASRLKDGGEIDFKLSGGALFLLTRLENWAYANISEKVSVVGRVSSNTGPLKVSYSTYSDTGNIKTVHLGGGAKTVVVHAADRATFGCNGNATASAAVSITHHVESITSPITAELTIKFPSFAAVFGPNVSCSKDDNFIEYYVYVTLDDPSDQVSWILIAFALGLGGLALVCLVSLFACVAWQYNKSIQADLRIERENKRRLREERMAQRLKQAREEEEARAAELEDGGADSILMEPTMTHKDRETSPLLSHETG